MSWTYNLGEGNLRKSSMLRRLNQGHYLRAVHEMMRWDRAGGRSLRGLIRRRGAEAALFMRGNTVMNLAKEHGVTVAALPTVDAVRGKQVADARNSIDIEEGEV